MHSWSSSYMAWLMWSKVMDNRHMRFVAHCRNDTLRLRYLQLTLSGDSCDDSKQTYISLIVDDLYLHNLLGCAHAYKHMGVRLIGVANKLPYLGRSWALPNDSKHDEAGFRRFWLIRCAYESLRCLDLEIWRFLCWRQTDKPIALPLLRMRARGVIKQSV
jgi:hypothetical protein